MYRDSFEVGLDKLWKDQPMRFSYREDIMERPTNEILTQRGHQSTDRT